VVGVEREKWSVDPFAGVSQGGHIYGRGAIDFKGGLAVFASAVLSLADRTIPLDRDVIFLVEADEESGGPHGTAWIAREHWDKIDAEFALNEGGWIIKGDDERVRYVSISTDDKQSVMVSLTALGTSTHSSMPLEDNAVSSLARAIARIAAYETPVQFTAESKQFFETLARTTAGPEGVALAKLVRGTPAEVREADRVVSADPLLHALMRNTLAPVIINGGFRSNVIPGSADATINMRLIPGTDPQVMVRLLDSLVADARVSVKLAGTAAARTIPPSSQDTELYTALAREAQHAWPEALVTPYLFQAGTDAGAWRNRSVPVYGIYPYPITNTELRRMHGNDERVSVKSLVQGTEFIYRTLVRVAGSAAAQRALDRTTPTRRP
jgi:acetylornithine deacetylase/succinyl-diaminopimelate desuccinylase-like protein